MKQTIKESKNDLEAALALAGAAKKRREAPGFWGVMRCAINFQC